MGLQKLEERINKLEVEVACIHDNLILWRGYATDLTAKYNKLMEERGGGFFSHFCPTQQSLRGYKENGTERRR